LIFNQSLDKTDSVVKSMAMMKSLRELFGGHYFKRSSHRLSEDHTWKFEGGFETRQKGGMGKRGG
jgi:hypothetical protein